MPLSTAELARICDFPVHDVFFVSPDRIAFLSYDAGEWMWSLYAVLEDADGLPFPWAVSGGRSQSRGTAEYILCETIKLWEPRRG